MMDPLEHVTVMITLIRQLEAVMERETLALKETRMADVEALQEEKTLLTEAYEIEMRRLRSKPEILGSLDDHVRLTLDEAVRDLQAAARRNANALEAAKTVIERLVEKLSAGMAKNSHGGRYGRDGGGYQPSHGGQAHGQVIAVAFNSAI